MQHRTNCLYYYVLQLPSGYITLILYCYWWSLWIFLFFRVKVKVRSRQLSVGGIRYSMLICINKIKIITELRICPWQNIINIAEAGINDLCKYLLLRNPWRMSASLACRNRSACSGAQVSLIPYWSSVEILVQQIGQICCRKKNPNELTFDFDFWCFNATFSNISAISWRPVLVVEEAGVPGENHRPWASNW